MAESRARTVLVKNNKFSELDSFTVDYGGSNIRYLNGSELWFCVGDVLSAIGYYRGDSYHFCNKVIKQENLIRARFSRNGSNFWFCNMSGVSTIAMAQKKKDHILSARSKSVLSRCKGALRDSFLKKHEVEEIIGEEMGVVELIPMNKGNLEIGTVNRNGKIYFAGAGLLRLLGYNYANVYSEIKNCGISDSNYIKILCRFKGRPSERFLVDQAAVNKIIDRHADENPEKNESIREWLCRKTGVIEDNSSDSKPKEMRKEVEDSEMKFEKLDREMVDTLNILLEARSTIFRFELTGDSKMEVVPCNNKWVKECDIELAPNFVIKLALWFKDTYGILLSTYDNQCFFGGKFCPNIDALQM